MIKKKYIKKYLVLFVLFFITCNIYSNEKNEDFIIGKNLVYSGFSIYCAGFALSYLIGLPISLAISNKKNMDKLDNALIAITCVGLVSHAIIAPILSTVGNYKLRNMKDPLIENNISTSSGFWYGLSGISFIATMVFIILISIDKLKLKDYVENLFNILGIIFLCSMVGFQAATVTIPFVKLKLKGN